MTPVAWPAPLLAGGTGEGHALTFDSARHYRLLVLPALFDEANRLRRFTVEVMRRLDASGIDCMLPDLPGCNESLQPLEGQTLAGWTEAAGAAARRFGATHVLAIRGGAFHLPPDLPGWRYACPKGASVLRQMLRARVIASREAGRTETAEGLLETGLRDGLELAGYRLGPALVRELQAAAPAPSPIIAEVPQDMLGGPGLWLRAEPGENREQADALAAIIAVGLRA